MKRVRRLSPLLLWLSLALWVAGAGLTGLGIHGDEQGWWTDRPFLTNIYSGATGAAFGIPLALIVLAEVTSRQRKHADLFDLVVSTQHDVDELNQSIRKFHGTLDFLNRPPGTLLQTDLTDASFDTLKQLVKDANRILERWREVDKNADPLFLLHDRGFYRIHDNLRLIRQEMYGLEEVASTISDFANRNTDGLDMSDITERVADIYRNIKVAQHIL